ncbi:MAG: protein rep [Polyangiaceae bacterium]
MHAREVVLAEARIQGLLRRNQKGGAWREKLLTLTAPHVAHHSIAERIRLLREAWPHFLKRFNRWQRERGSHGTTRWLRNFEWTPASDGRGHPHCHVWIFSQYLPRNLLLEWWSAALLLVGYESADLECLVIDVRAVTNGERSAYELIKYMTKDITTDGTKIAPELFSEVYCALDGKRTTQASSGFMKLAVRRTECACGACGWFSVRIVAAESSYERLPTNARATSTTARPLDSPRSLWPRIVVRDSSARGGYDRS